MEINDHEAANNITTINNASCSACKYQRKRCKPDCILRKHFPANKYNEFKNVQKIFGIANITKIIKGANNSSEAEREIVESLCWEGDEWAKYPTSGPYREFEAQKQELKELKSKQQIMEAVIGTNYLPNANMNMMDVNYLYNADLSMDSYASSYTRNGSMVFQRRSLQHGNNNGLVNNQGIMENGNWRELRGNGIQQWREQGMGNFGPSSHGHAPFVNETEINRTGATIQDFDSKKYN